VVGFGFDENGQLSEELKMASLKVVSQSECSNVNEGGSLTSINSRSTTYCAGLKNKTNVCNGDSGGGMVFPLKSEDTTRWYLQGIVSAGLSDRGKCDPEKYSVFTRVGRYASWITRTLSHYDVLK
jgi:secreted trypsin-like serine protease